MEVRNVGLEGIVIHRGDSVLEADFGPGDTGQLTTQAALEACRAQEAVQAVDAPLPPHGPLCRLRVRGQSPAHFPGRNRLPPASHRNEEEYSKGNEGCASAATRRLLPGSGFVRHLFCLASSLQIQLIAMFSRKAGVIQKHLRGASW